MAGKSGQLVSHEQDCGALRRVLLSIEKLLEKDLSSSDYRPAETNGIDSHKWVSKMQFRDVFYGKTDAAPPRSKEQW